MLDFSRIGIGSVQFGLDYGISNKNGKPSQKEIALILDSASDLGINLIDTANSYGNSEIIIGRFNNARFDCVTKFLPELSNGSIEYQLNQSLNNLKSKSLYGLLAHRPYDLVQNPLQWDKLNELKKKGKVKKIGFSFSSPEEFYEISAKSFLPDIVQLPYNYFDNRFENIIKDLKSSGCEIHSRSTFMQGLFFMNVEDLPTFFDEVKPAIRLLQETYKGTVASVLLKYVLNNKNIDKIVVGVQSKFELEQMVHSIDISSKLNRLEFTVDNSILQPSLWPNN
ncbi:aldo/keto reductase [Aquirufa lenticrescens]